MLGFQCHSPLLRRQFRTRVHTRQQRYISDICGQIRRFQSNFPLGRGDTNPPISCTRTIISRHQRRVWNCLCVMQVRVWVVVILPTGCIISSVFDTCSSSTLTPRPCKVRQHVHHGNAERMGIVTGVRINLRHIVRAVYALPHRRIVVGKSPQMPCQCCDKSQSV